jgi:Rad51.
MFYKVKDPSFVFAHEYLLKSFKIDIQKNQFIELTIGSPVIFLNLYNLIPKLAIKALLPRNHGGIESSTVTIIDGSIRGQSTHLDFYSFVDYAIEYGMNVNSALEKIIVTRSFTAHQLADTIICNLTKMIQKYKSNLVIITDLFATDEQLHLSERKWLLNHMINSISGISKSIITVVFSPVVIDGFQKVISMNAQQKSKITTTSSPKKGVKINGQNNSIF